MSNKYSGFAERLVEARDSSGLTVQAFSRLCGIARPTIDAYEAGTSAPGAEKLWRMAEVLGVSPGYLWTGKEPEPPVDPLNDPSYKTVKLEGIVAAGIPVQLKEFRNMDDVVIHKAIQNRCGANDLGACWCLGDSMEPVIKDKSLVVYNKALIKPTQIKKTAIYIVNIPDEEGGTIKRLRYREMTKEIDLIPANPEHEIQTYKARDVQIRGKVCGIIWQDI